MTAQELEAAVKSLQENQKRSSDRQAILDCLTAYTRALDRLDRELMQGCFHRDAQLDYGVIVAGPAEFTAWAIDLHERAADATQHYLGTHSCDLDGDEAHCETYWLGCVKGHGGAGISFAGGRWLDRFERRGDEWKIKLRKCIGEWSGTPVLESVPEISRNLHGAMPQPTRDRSDPSYERPFTIDPERLKQMLAG